MHSRLGPRFPSPSPLCAGRDRCAACACRRSIGLALGQYRPGDARHLVGQGHGDHLGRPAARAAIEALFQQWVKAHADRDADAIVEAYAPDAVIHELAPPLVRRGMKRDSVAAWLAGWDGPIQSIRATSISPPAATPPSPQRVCRHSRCRRREEPCPSRGERGNQDFRSRRGCERRNSLEHLSRHSIASEIRNRSRPARHGL